MAEFVEAWTEKTIENLNQLCHIGLLTEEEAKNIIKCRQNYEYHLARHTKRKNDYTNYIQYEIDLLEMIRLRRKKARNFARKRLDFELINRIHALFRSCIFRFQNEVDLWFMQIEFAKKHRQLEYVGRLYKRMLQVHVHRTDIWLSAANFEVEIQQADAARKIFLTALRFNKENRDLWLGYQRFELRQCVAVKKAAAEAKAKAEETDSALVEPEAFPEAILDGRLALLAFRKAIEATSGNNSLHVDLLEIWREVADKELAEKYVDELFSLLEVDSNAELTAAWCRRPMIGALPGCQLEAFYTSIGFFDEKLKTGDPAIVNSGILHSLQLAFIVGKINKFLPKKSSKDCDNSERQKLISKINELIVAAYDLKVEIAEPTISESISLIMAEKVSPNFEIIHSSVTTYPTSRRLWLLLFECLCSSDAKKAQPSSSVEPFYLQFVKESFRVSFANTKSAQEDAMAVWRAAMQLCISQRLPIEQLDSVWRQAVDLHFDQIAPIYLEWAYHSNALASSPWQAAELAFSKITKVSVKRPLPLQLHVTRLNLAMSTLASSLYYRHIDELKMFCELDAASVRRVFDEALVDIGSRFAEFWLLWVTFEATHGDTESLAHTAWRARRALPAEILTDFNSEYAKITSAACNLQTQADVVSKMRMLSK